MRIHWAGRDSFVFALPSEATPCSIPLPPFPCYRGYPPIKSMYTFKKGRVFLWENPGHVCYSPVQFTNRKQQKEGPGLYDQKVME